jgi:hypothetical protein
VNIELWLKNLDTKYLHNSYIFARFRQTKQELRSLVICGVCNKWTSFISVCFERSICIYKERINELCGTGCDRSVWLSIEYLRNGSVGRTAGVNWSWMKHLMVWINTVHFNLIYDWHKGGVHTNIRIHKKHVHRFLAIISVCECSLFDFEQCCIIRTLTLSLIMSYIYIYGAPCKAWNFNVVYIYIYIYTYIYGPAFGNAESRLFLFAAQCFNTESMQEVILYHNCV